MTVLAQILALPILLHLKVVALMLYQEENHTVLNSAIKPEKYTFMAITKPPQELELAIQNHVRIVVDNPYELSIIKRISESKHSGIHNVSL